MPTNQHTTFGSATNRHNTGNGTQLPCVHSCHQKYFFEFIGEQVQSYQDEQRKSTKHILLVAHNGKRFDIRFLETELEKNDLLNLLLTGRFGYAIDTQLLAQTIVRNNKLTVPKSYKLSDIYEYVSNSKMGSDSHKAFVDVRATSAVLRFDSFWQERKNNMFCFLTERQQQQVTTADDSDLDVSDDEEQEEEQVENNEESESVFRTGWQRDTDFHGLDTETKFQEYYRKKTTRQSVGDRTGLQCSPHSVNSPAKAWRQIFTHALLDMIVEYTNQYGCERCKDWVNINRQDLMDFIAILFISE